MGYWRDDYCTLTNCYYESGTATCGVQCYDVDDVMYDGQGGEFAGKAEVKSGAMPTVLSIVGTAFKGDAGEPILTWQ